MDAARVRVVLTRAPFARSCAAAPLAAEEDSFSVVASRGGVKGLRALLLLTPEWNTAWVRDAAAAALEADGDASCADAIRSKVSAQLSKSTLLRLCRIWAYRSDLWCRKGDMQRKRPRRAAASGSAAQPGVVRPLASVGGSEACAVTAVLALLARRHSLPSTGAISSPAVAALLAGPLAAQLRRSSTSFAGPRTRHTTLALRRAPFPRVSLSYYAHCAASLHSLAARWRTAAAEHCAWAASKAGASAEGGDIQDGQGGDADTRPAWECLLTCHCDAPVEGVLLQLQALLATAQRTQELVHTGRCNAGAAPSEALLTLQDELACAAREAGGAACAAALLLAQLRACATFATYAAAGGLLLEHLANYADDTAAAYKERAAWGARSLADGVAAADDVASDSHLAVVYQRLQSAAALQHNGPEHAAVRALADGSRPASPPSRLVECGEVA